MGQPKLTGFLIAMVLVSMFAGIFGLLILQNPYGLADTQNITLDKYNKLNEISTSMYATSNQAKQLQQQQGVFDLVGGFFGSAFKTLLSIPENIGLMNDMVDQAMLDMNLGAGGIIIKNALETIILILVFVGIVLAAIIKWVL